MPRQSRCGIALNLPTSTPSSVSNRAWQQVILSVCTSRAKIASISGSYVSPAFRINTWSPLARARPLFHASAIPLSLSLIHCSRSVKPPRLSSQREVPSVEAASMTIHSKSCSVCCFKLVQVRCKSSKPLRTAVMIEKVGDLIWFGTSELTKVTSGPSWQVPFRRPAKESSSCLGSSKSPSCRRRSIIRPELRCLCYGVD